MPTPATATKNQISAPFFFSFFSILDFQIYAIFSNNQLHHLTFDRDHHMRYQQFFTALSQAPNSLTAQWQEKTLSYLENNGPELGGTHAHGTDFQQQVWKEIQRIPYGQTKTYGDLAEQLGSRHLARAVGNACHTNPVAIYTPCHRVIGKNNIGGYAGGTLIKKRLLKFEQEQACNRD